MAGWRTLPRGSSPRLAVTATGRHGEERNGAALSRERCGHPPTWLGAPCRDACPADTTNQGALHAGRHDDGVCQLRLGELPDARVWDEEIRLARLAADLGFDCLWSAEHHCNDYSFVPDNLQLLTYLTALFPNVDLGTAAVIVPWHDPLRVAENAAVLDLLSQGRLRLGLGRGLARREFAAFRLSMDESRERFDEAAPMIVEALKTGFIEGDGKFYKQPRIAIRPRPQYAFHGRIYAVASSEDSIDSAAKLGAHIVMFADRPWEMRLPNIERGRALHRQYHGTEPPQIMLTEFCVCSPNLAEEEARR